MSYDRTRNPLHVSKEWMSDTLGLRLRAPEPYSTCLPSWLRSVSQVYSSLGMATATFRGRRAKSSGPGTPRKTRSSFRLLPTSRSGRPSPFTSPISTGGQSAALSPDLPRESVLILRVALGLSGKMPPVARETLANADRLWNRWWSLFLPPAQFLRRESSLLFQSLTVPRLLSPRVPPRTTNEPGALRQIAGRVPNFPRTAAHSPGILRWLVPFVQVVQREGPDTVLSGSIRELAILKTSIINQCGYCASHNRALALGTGITDEQLDAIEGSRYLESDLFSERERLAIAWAESVTLNRARSDGKLFGQLEGCFTSQEIVELTFAIAMFNMINRVNESLHVDLEDEQEIVKIRSRVDLNEAALRAYVAALADSWKLPPST